MRERRRAEADREAAQKQARIDAEIAQRKKIEQGVINARVLAMRKQLEAEARERTEEEARRKIEAEEAEVV